MAETLPYPLRFEPIYHYRIWGGRRLAAWLDAPLPGAGPIGEAWLLSDRNDFPSRVANGPLKGFTIAQLMQQSPEGMIGRSLGYVSRFPLLLKFLDVRTMLSVQVHPCIDLPQPAIQPVVPVTEMIDPAMRERLFDCRHFRLWRLHGAEPFNVGEADEPRALVCIGGKGNIEFGGADFAIERGAAMLLPAAVGACRVRPEGALKLLEIAVPHRPLMTASTSARTGRSAP